jgi:glycosyltransferase involved in cell wall biosynthesis
LASGKTGLGRNSKAILPPLYKTDKYELFFLAQGMNDGDPSFQKVPFKVEGVFKNFDQQRFQQDPNYQRVVAYGNTAVEDFVVKNKLDIVVLLDDFWAGMPDFYFKTDWYQHIKQNFMFVATADSEPILPLGKEWAENCPNMRFWSDFASRALKEEDPQKYGHCSTIHGAIHVPDFKPLLKNERLELRRKFGIADNEKIIIYLGRNQLRKIFGSHMEGLVKFKKQNPDKKLRLLFHCQWSEPMGWPLNQIREQLKLDKADVLATYYCRTCADWNIQPYDGEDLDCPHCQSKKSKVTAGVGSTITEQDLNKIYNIADGSASIFTSGGQEYTNIESLLAGVPLACPNYSCGEDFCQNDFVYTIKGGFVYEHNTGFKKFAPEINSVLKFFEYIYDLSESKKKEITDKGRKWAIEQFDANNIAKIYEKFFDSCKPIDWETFLAKKKELKNLNAQVEDKESDDDFVMECYNKILNMQPTSGDGGRIHWNNFLKQARDKGQLKQEMVGCMRQAGYVHNSKVQPNSLENLLDKTDKSRVLLVLKESLGDCYILTSLLPEIKNKYPNASIYIGCDPKYWEVFDSNQYAHRLIPWLPEMDNEMQMTGFAGHKGFFNYYHNIGIGTQKLLNYLSSKYE